MIHPAEVVQRKRDGEELSPDELEPSSCSATRAARFPTTRWPHS